MTIPSAISVVIPTWNRAHLIARSIDSALAAMSPGDELIIPDDGSTDDTAAVVARYGDRVRHVPRPHQGPGATRNAGIQAATKPLVAFLDSDDEWDRDKLTLQRTLMDARPDVVFSFSDFRVRETNGTILPRFSKQWRPDDHRTWREILGDPTPFSSLAPVPHGRDGLEVYLGDMYLPLFQSAFIGTFTLVVRRERAGDAFRFAEDVSNFEDLECFARLARLGTAAYLDCETATQHGHSGPRITDANIEVLGRTKLVVLERVWGLDQAFLERHREEYDREVRQQHLFRARWLICQGRTREARTELQLAGQSPAAYRFLASLPGFVAKGLLRARRVVQGGRSIT